MIGALMGGLVAGNAIKGVTKMAKGIDKVTKKVGQSNEKWQKKSNKTSTTKSNPSPLSKTDKIVKTKQTAKPKVKSLETKLNDMGFGPGK